MGKTAGERLDDLLEAIAGDCSCDSVAESLGRTCDEFEGCSECQEWRRRSVLELARQVEGGDAPLGADGVPIRPGDVVRAAGDEGEVAAMTVREVVSIPRALMDFHSEGSIGYDVRRLVHVPPDSWEDVELDATLDPMEYALRRGVKLEPGDVPHERMALDLVARARRLARAEGGAR